MVGYYVIAGACGFTVAVAEILSRYKSAPWKGVCCRWGGVYIAFNVLMGVAAFAVLAAADTVSADADTLEKLGYALLAGFGAMTVLRTKLFNLRSESGEKISVGPDFVIDTFLAVVDREIDRNLACERAKIIKDSMRDVDFEKAHLPMFYLVRYALQNLSRSDLTDLGDRVGQISKATDLPPQEKAYALGFMLMDVAGEGFFRKMFNQKAMGDYKLKMSTAAVGSGTPSTP